LNALGVAMSVGAGAAISAGTATSAAASVASAGLSAGAPSTLPASSLATQAGGQALISGGALASKGALIGAAGAGKLLALPLAVKAGLAVVAVGSALVAPKLFSAPDVPPPAIAVERAEQPNVTRSPERSTAVSPAEQTAPALTPAAPSDAVESRVRSLAPRRPSNAARAVADAPPHAPESTLAAESALLAEALSALRSGRTERAHELLARHEEIDGAHAQLARERERMRRELSHLLR
jgi:hypothetical protein